MLKRKASSSVLAARSICTRCSNFQQPVREAVNAMLSNIMNQIEKHKASNGRKQLYGAISSIVADNKEAFPWLDANKINYHMQKLNIHDLLPVADENTDPSMLLTPNMGDISSLTDNNDAEAM